MTIAGQDDNEYLTEFNISVTLVNKQIFIFEHRDNDILVAQKTRLNNDVLCLYVCAKALPSPVIS